MAKQKLSHTDIKVIQQHEAKSAIDFVTKNYSAVVALCLHDKLGFGKQRAQRFMQQVDELFDSINKGYLSLDDVIAAVKEELGIEIF